MMREMVEESLSGTWAGMAQGDLAPEMMSSTKLSTVSRERGEDTPQVMTQMSPGLWRVAEVYAHYHAAMCRRRPRIMHGVEVGAEVDTLLFQQGSSPWHGADTSAAWQAGEGLLSLPQDTGYIAASPCKEGDRGSLPTSPSHPPQRAPIESLLTCLHLGVVHPVGDFLLTEEVVNDLHPNGGF